MAYSGELSAGLERFDDALGEPHRVRHQLPRFRRVGDVHGVERDELAELCGHDDASGIASCSFVVSLTPGSGYTVIASFAGDIDYLRQPFLSRTP